MQEEPNRPAACPQPGAAWADSVSLGIFQRKGAKKSRDFLGKGNLEVAPKCVLSRLEQMPEINFRNGGCARGLWGAHAPPRALSGVRVNGTLPSRESRVPRVNAVTRQRGSLCPPENRVRRDAEHHTRDGYAPQTLAAPALLNLFQPTTRRFQNLSSMGQRFVHRHKTDVRLFASEIKYAATVPTAAVTTQVVHIGSVNLRISIQLPLAQTLMELTNAMR
jgi:hypothetical protein